jgi:hypothetical protein
MLIFGNENAGFKYQKHFRLYAQPGAIPNSIQRVLPGT